MSFKLSDITTRVHTFTGQIAKASASPMIATAEPEETLICDLVRQGCRRIAVETQRLDVNQIFNMTAGVSVYKFKDTFDAIYWVHLLGPDNVSRLERVDWVLNFESAAGSEGGTPLHYGINGLQLQLDVPPATTTLETYPQLRITGTLNSGFPATSTQDVVDVMPPEFEHPLGSFVIAEYLQLVAPGMGNVIAQYKQDFEKALALYRGNPKSSKFAQRVYRGI